MSSYGQKNLVVEFNKPSRTKQSFKKATDIRSILERHKMTGQMSRAKGQPLTGDFSTVEDYHSALNKVYAIDSTFAKLPAKVRDRFKNKPSELLSFVFDENNRDEAIKLGLIEKPVDGSTSTGEEPASGSVDESASSGTTSTTDGQ